MNIKTKNKGFTIIEVVLVLAIAGLIFMMVFIALPALQRSQRDTQRKNDLSRAITALNSYQSNNRGNLPTNTSAFWNNTFRPQYITVAGDTFADPSGNTYTFSVQTTAMPSGTTFNSAAPTIRVVYGAVCNGDTLTTGQGTRKVALQMKLEGGGIACQSN